MGIPGSPNALLMRRAAVSDEAEAYLIENSLRINKGDTPYLDRSFGEGNRRRWTIAFWAKRGELGLDVNNAEYVIFSTSCTNTPCNAILQFYNDDSLNIFLGYIGSKSLRTNRKFRDVGSWYHFCISFQAGHSENTERMKIWVNGREETSFASDDRSGMTDTDWGISIKQNHRIGNNGNANRSYDGLLSDFHFIDGEFLHPAAFGEFDATGVWTPKKFAMPTPNTGVTWSGMMTSETGSWYSSSNVNLFNGVLGAGSAGQTASASAEDKWIKFTPTGGLKFKQSIRVQHWPGGNSPYLQVKYTLKLTDGREAILEVPSSNSSNAFFTLFEGAGTIEYIQQVTSNNQYNNWGALEIDGIMLVDGQTDSATRNNVNNGTTWSVYGDDTNINSSYPWTKAFDGVADGTYGNGAGADDGDGWARWTPTGGITVDTLLRINTDNGTTSAVKVKFSSGSNTAVQHLTSLTDGWNTVDGSGTLEYIEIYNSGSVWSYLCGVEIDGHVLVDSVSDNSFHLKFNDTSRNSALGKDSLNGKIADATGGLPFYNTSGDYGDVKGSGYRTDSSAGTTDGTGLVLALPGDVLTDEHDHINTGSSANTITNNGTVVVSTDESRFYGSSLKFSGSNRLSAASNTDFVLGGGDWCIEFWMRPDDVSGTEILIENDTGTGGISIQKNGDDIEVQMGSLFDPGTTVLAKQWQHVAVTRSGSTTSLFLNGALQGTTSTDAGSSQAGFEIGQRSSGSLGYSGYLQDIRVYKGQAKYTVGFKPPIRGDFEPTNLTETDGVVTKTNADSKPILGTSDDFGKTYSSGYETDSNSSSLVLAISGKTLADNHADVKGSGTNHNISNSSSSTSTARSKFYGTAVETDGGSQHFVVADSSDFEFGSGEFTIEYWINAEDVANDGMASWLMKGTNSSNNSFDWRAYASMDGSNANIYCDFSTSDGNKYLGENVNNMPNDEWVHFAAVRDNTDNKFYIYKNGVKFDDASVASGATMNDNYSDGLTWGYFNAISGSNHYGFDGWVNDIRIYKGFCKYPGGTTFNVVTEGAPYDLDVVVDTPTNYAPDSGSDGDGGVTRGNYCTLNQNDQLGDSVSRGNLYLGTHAGHRGARGTVGLTSGKWYWEYTTTTSGTSYHGIGTRYAVTNYDHGSLSTFKDFWYLYSTTTTKNLFRPGADDSNYLTSTGAPVGEVIQVMLDMDNYKVKFGVDNTFGAEVDLASTIGSSVGSYKEIFPIAKKLSWEGYVNFGQQPFRYAAPAGYSAVCTQNLDNTFDGEDSENNPSHYFDIKLWTGNGVSPRSFGGLSFQPDLVWFKQRSDGRDHMLYDQVRGTGTDKSLASNNNYAQDQHTTGSYGYLSAFTSDGFTLTNGSHGSSNDIYTNDDGETYVAWCWDAGTAANSSPGSGGDMTATTQWVNTAAGFSISKVVKPDSTTNQTFEHGLGVKPLIVLQRRYDVDEDWYWYTSQVDDSHDFIVLNDDSGKGDTGTPAPTASVATTMNAAGNYLVYCWAPVAGFSSFGRFEGNGGTNFIHTGFLPKFIIIRNSGSNRWVMLDRERHPLNGTNNGVMWAERYDQESVDSENNLDYLSNGFCMRCDNGNANGSGSTYIYCAWAEHPFKTARAS